ncbi:MAG: sorbosone dehydrogenase family protein, partial [bacterium]|nr:sorbosone dehydrogenase family protein [bacterium]
MTTTQKTLILIVFLLFLSACSATPEAVQPTPKDPPATPPTYEESEVTYQNPSLPLHTIKLPEGFHISLFATNIKGARSLELTENGPASRTPSKNKGEGWTLFVGSRAEGKVYALKDRDGDFKADQVFTIASGLESPNGVAFKDGNLYVTEISRILRFDDIENRLENPPAPVVVSDDFPTETHHGWKFIGIGPDDRLYVPVGAPCNICLSEDSLFASITSMELDGSDRRIVASGIRNTV